MNGARLVGRGLSDTFENLITYVLVTLAWWGCLLLIVPGPAATLALFAHADPRHGSLTDRLTWSETLHFMVNNLWRAWRLALITVPVMALLIYNMVFYMDQSSMFGVFAPLWLVLLIFSIAVSAAAFSLAALEQIDAKSAVKSAAIIVGARIPKVIVMLLLLGVVVAIGSALVVPAILFLPATIAATVNRLVLESRNVDIPNSLTPTAERLAEAKTGRRTWWGP